MATPRGAKDVAFVLVGGRDVMASVTALDIEREAVVKPTTALGATWPTHQFTGLKLATITQSGFYDSAAGGANEALCGNEGSLQVVSIGLEGNTAGRRMTCAAGAFSAKYKRTLALEDLHKATANYTVSGETEDAVILATYATRTSAGNSESGSVDNTVLTSAGGAGYCQVNALTLGGYTNLALKVRHSSDNATFADLVAFTVVTAAPAAERKTCAGTVNRYLAASWSFTGSGAGPSATFVVGFARA